MKPRGQLALDLGHRPALGREDFLVAPCNREAVAWLDRWPEWPAPVLVIYGPAACGKTYLAHVWRMRSGARMLRHDDLGGAEPPELLGSANAVAVEDAERTAGIEERERALFHLRNLLAERRGHLLLTARTAPPRWGLALADLGSRLAATPWVAVGAPDDELIGAVLVKLFADRQLPVGREVIAYLVTHMERSFAAARRTVATIDAAALAEKRRVTIPLVRKALQGGER